VQRRRRLGPELHAVQQHIVVPDSAYGDGTVTAAYDHRMCRSHAVEPQPTGGIGTDD
jgi:hypothetical protein